MANKCCILLIAFSFILLAEIGVATPLTKRDLTGAMNRMQSYIIKELVKNTIRQTPQKRKKGQIDITNSTTTTKKQSATVEYPGETTRRLGLEINIRHLATYEPMYSGLDYYRTNDVLQVEIAGCIKENHIKSYCIQRNGDPKDRIIRNWLKRYFDQLDGPSYIHHHHYHYNPYKAHYRQSARTPTQIMSRGNRQLYSEGGGFSANINQNNDFAPSFGNFGDIGSTNPLGRAIERLRHHHHHHSSSKHHPVEAYSTGEQLLFRTADGQLQSSGGGFNANINLNNEFSPSFGNFGDIGSMKGRMHRAYDDEDDSDERRSKQSSRRRKDAHLKSTGGGFNTNFNPMI
uniref:Uncharacterized protein n=1 Tax=Strigamia maritima TaxID=126957 RepID=T1IL22_STRMM